MPLSFIIAWRNLFRHKVKSLVIGVILFLGALLMTVGNGVISGMDHGLEENIVNGFLGDIVIMSDKQKSDNILFDFMGSSIESIGNYQAIKPVLQAQAFVDRFLPVGKNMVMTLSEDVDAAPNGLYLLGADIEAYQAMFPGALSALEGRMLNPGERGILVSTHTRTEQFMLTNTWVLPEGGKVIEANLDKDAKEAYGKTKELKSMDNFVLMGMSEVNSATDQRFFVKGIVKYRALNTIFGHFNLTDIESYRETLGYFTAASNQTAVAKEDKALLEMGSGDLDALFGGDAMIVSNIRKKVPAAEDKPVVQMAKAPEDAEAGAYNLILVKVKDRVSPAKALKDLNQALASAKLGVRAVGWKKASGMIGSLSTLIKGSLLVFVGFLFLVAIIIIVNTLTMAALERIPEIGMMRAVGAQKKFVRSMFFAEIGALSAVFGGAGIVLGWIAVKIIPLLKLTTDNDFVQLLYGGTVFSPRLLFSDVFVTVLELGFVTLIAALYPVRIASNIKPLDAIARD